MTRLGDIATYINGYAFKPDDWGSVGLPIIRIQDLTGNSYQTNRYAGEYNKKYEVNPGDVLISWSASLGVYIWDNEKALLNQHIFKVIFDKGPINKSFFVYQVKRILDKASNEVHGATMKHLTKPVFDALPFYLPSMDEQIHIASVLDTVAELINLYERKLVKLDELVKARFVEMFGDPTANNNHYPIASLSTIAEYWNGLTYRPEDVVKDGTIVLRSSNIQNGQLDYTDLVRVGCKIPLKKFVEKNDILMCSRNGSAKLVGKVALISQPGEKMTFGAFMMIIRSEYYPYLMTYFQLPAFRRQTQTGATTTINQITVNMLNNIVLPIPDVETVHHFSAFLTQVDKSKAAVQSALDKAQLLFDSLMQKYFG